MEVFRLIGKIALDGKAKVEKGLGEITKRAGGLGKAMAVSGAAIAAMGAVAVGVAFKIVNNWAKAGDEIEKMSRRTGIAAESLSELKHAAELSGTSLSAVESSVKRMSRAIIDAGSGLMTYQRAFDRIGLSVEELKELGPEEQFTRISEAIAGLESATERAAAAQEIFGRGGTQLLPMFDAGAEGLKAMREEAHELGIVFDQESAEAAAKFTDDMLRLKKSFEGIVFQLAKAVAPALNKFVIIVKDDIIPIIEKLNKLLFPESQTMERIKAVNELLRLNGKELASAKRGSEEYNNLMAKRIQFIKELNQLRELNEQSRQDANRETNDNILQNELISAERQKAIDAAVLASQKKSTDERLKKEKTAKDERIKIAEETAKEIAEVENNLVSIVIDNLDSMEDAFLAFGNFVIKHVIEEIARELIRATGLAAALRAALSAVSGGVLGFLGFQHGADFVVPPGFPNDSFMMGATSGEHVNITPAGQSSSAGGRGDINLAIEVPIENLNLNQDNADMQLDQMRGAIEQGGIEAIRLIKAIDSKSVEFAGEA